MPKKRGPGRISKFGFPCGKKDWKSDYQQTLDHLKDGPVKVYKLPLSDKPTKSTL